MGTHQNSLSHAETLRQEGQGNFFEKCTPLHITWYYHYRSGYKVLWKCKEVHKILSLFMLQNWILSKEQHKVPVLSCRYKKYTKRWKHTIPTAVSNNLIMGIALRALRLSYFNMKVEISLKWFIILTNSHQWKIENDLSNSLKRLR